MVSPSSMKIAAHWLYLRSDEANGALREYDKRDTESLAQLIDGLTPPVSVPEMDAYAEGHTKPCYYCGNPTDMMAGNPSLWPIPLCHPDDPGRVKWHHIGCVSKRLHPVSVEGPLKGPLPDGGLSAACVNTPEFYKELSEFLASDPLASRSAEKWSQLLATLARQGKRIAELEASQADAPARPEPSTTSSPATTAVMDALEQSVKHQSHYATLLNSYDGGERMTFANAAEWIARLELVSRMEGKE